MNNDVDLGLVLAFAAISESKDAMAAVEAIDITPNPTISGSESILTGIEVGGTSYRINIPTLDSSDSGKFLTVDASGNVIATTMPVLGGGNY